MYQNTCAMLSIFFAFLVSVVTSVTTIDMTVADGSLTYSKPDIVINAGDSVTWTFPSSTPHTVTQSFNRSNWCDLKPGGVDSGSLSNGQSFTWTSKKAGRFYYFSNIGQECAQGLKGFILVKDAVETSSNSSSWSSSNSTEWPSGYQYSDRPKKCRYRKHWSKKHYDGY